jgi:transcriptional regulator with XRE-family HTH domain
MKKYQSLADLLIDVRAAKNMTQLDLAVELDIDIRTIKRWESGDTLFKDRMEVEVARKLNIPYQVIHNLNSSRPIPMYYDIENRQFASTIGGLRIPEAKWLKFKLATEDSLFRTIDPEADFEIIQSIFEIQGLTRPCTIDILKKAVQFAPDVNVVFHDQSGFYAGHLILLKIRSEFYDQLTQNLESLQSFSAFDIDNNADNEGNPIYLFYSHYADSLANSYYVMSRLFSFFETNHSKNHRFCAVESRPSNIALAKQMGMNEITRDTRSNNQEVLLVGNLNEFLQETI